MQTYRDSLLVCVYNRERERERDRLTCVNELLDLNDLNPFLIVLIDSYAPN